jgi:hypothetical protein
MKQRLFGLLAVLLAIAAVSFTTPKSTFTTYWYTFNSGSQNSIGSYSSVGTTVDPGCADVTRLCAIAIPNDNGSLSQGELQDALDTYGDGTSFTSPISGFVEFKP